MTARSAPTCVLMGRAIRQRVNLLVPLEISLILSPPSALSSAETVLPVKIWCHSFTVNLANQINGATSALRRSLISMYLSLCNLRDANFLMDDMKKQVQQVREVDFPQSELMQFIIYLLQTLQRDALPLFNIIRQRYKSSLDREPILNELLDEVAWKFYGVRRRNSMPGMFGEIFKMMAEE